MLAFTDATLDGAVTEITECRAAVESLLGPDRVVEAAAVCACLQMMNRITLATGVPLSRGRMVRTREVRRRAGLDALRHE